MSTYNTIYARGTDTAPRSSLHTQTVAFSHYNNISAQLPVDPRSGKVVAGGVAEQARQCLANIKAILESIDHVMDDVVRITIFLRHISDIEAVDDVCATFFTSYVPTRTTLAVADLPMDALVQIEAVVSNGEGTIPGAPQAGDLVKVARNTENAPTSPGATQTVAFSHYNNISAQLPIDPESGNLVAGGVREQAGQCLNNVKTILGSIGHVMDDVVRNTIFLKNISDVSAVDEVYATFFPNYVPARTTVAVAGLPMDALVQVEAVVSHGDGTPPQAPEDARRLVIEANDTENAPKDPRSSQTVAFSHYNHISAQLPLDPRTGGMVPGGTKEHASQCLANIQAILESIDHRMDDVVKLNVYLRDMAEIDAVDEVCTTYFPSYVPARRTVGVSALPGDALVQIEAVVSNAEGTPPAA
ncbi:reactive intermediate/imine deaminase [Georgenia yuyongxinii]|uniref:Reactive intermediate/imine deaminase n=1 Tax=Georgenia yuyongxinii TaxID=2589797 RepID=A0A5B8C201_9MICO|nr:RidA family protein [Georgenia yuyongxinii]QDC24564.1 reactive intermediate/imine deaminase [Georgenia yuyongxinii]